MIYKNFKEEKWISYLKHDEFKAEEFDWECYSDLIPKYAPQYFDSFKYNWRPFIKDVDD